MMENIVIIGAGNFSKLVLDIFSAQNKNKKKYNILGFIDENKNKGYKIKGIDVLGDFDWFAKNRNKDFKVICSVANPQIKKKLVNKAQDYNLSFVNAIHPDTTISDSSSIGEGIIINAGTIIASDVKLKNYSLVNFNCTLGHDVVLNKYSSVMPGVNLAGYVNLKECSYIGMNSSIIQNVTVGSNSTIGAGAAVVSDIPDNVTAVGVPAQVI